MTTDSASRTQRPDSDPLARELERVRFSGFKGGFISKHRALLFSPIDAPKLTQAALLMALMAVLWYLLLPLVNWFWGLVLLRGAHILHLVGAVNRPETYSVAGLITFEVPALYVPVGLPPRWVWEVGVVFAAALLAISLVLPGRFLPLGYLLRVIALVQMFAQIFFAFWPNRFPYAAGGYIHTMLLASTLLIWLIPAVLALTFYLFDFTLKQRLALTGLVMGHLTVMVPLQYLLHALVLYHLSLLFLPVLFFVFSLPLTVLVFIAFYGWGFSWNSPLREERVQWKIRAS